VAFALVRHKGAEAMVGWFASDYQCHLIGLLLCSDHFVGNSGDLDAIGLDRCWPRILRGGAIALLWLSAYRGVAVEARGREISARVSGPTTSTVVTSALHSYPPKWWRLTFEVARSPFRFSAISNRSRSRIRDGAQLVAAACGTPVLCSPGSLGTARRTVPRSA
jgi:hypothetical protein